MARTTSSTTTTTSTGTTQAPDLGSHGAGLSGHGKGLKEHGKGLAAKAYASGQNPHLASRRGGDLLAHEAAHVVQQRAGR